MLHHLYYVLAFADDCFSYNRNVPGFGVGSSISNVETAEDCQKFCQVGFCQPSVCHN